MVSTGIVQLLQMEEEKVVMQKLGYPEYFMVIIGIWKLLGVVAVLIPKYALIKEWAYAGFFFLMSGALLSHALVGDEANAYFGPALLLVLSIVSWFFRPTDRKITLRPF